MKPNWENAPCWANYLAQDADGSWYWFEFEPHPDGHAKVWDTQKTPNGYGHFEEALEKNVDWVDTMEKRPC